MNGQASNIDGDNPLPEVYVALVGDIVHAGHINIIKHAVRLGRVTVGLLTDEAAASYKRVPLMSFSERKLLFENMKGVATVIAQQTLSYRENLLAIKPKFVVHGDDWKQGIQASVRQEVIDILRSWGGEIVEIPYTPGISSTLLQEGLREEGVLARFRQGKLRMLLQNKPLVRIIEVHNSVSAVIAERAGAGSREFDGFWSSSLIDSITHGKPDMEVLDYRTRAASITEIFEVTTKPLIYDGDSGRSPEHCYHLSKALDACGVSAVCIEDKRGQKSNSLYGQASGQEQASCEEFCERLMALRSAAPYSSMMIIARIESLVLGRPIEEALERADAYCKNGADAILIHSVELTAKEVFTFADKFKKSQGYAGHPLFVVPTTYSDVYEKEMIENGIDAVIYANHLLRASYIAMARAAEDILAHERSAELNGYCVSCSELLRLFPGRKI